MAKYKISEDLDEDILPFFYDLAKALKITPAKLRKLLKEGNELVDCEDDNAPISEDSTACVLPDYFNGPYFEVSNQYLIPEGTVSNLHYQNQCKEDINTRNKGIVSIVSLLELNAKKQEITDNLTPGRVSLPYSPNDKQYITVVRKGKGESHYVDAKDVKEVFDDVHNPEHLKEGEWVKIKTENTLKLTIITGFESPILVNTKNGNFSIWNLTRAKDWEIDNYENSNQPDDFNSITYTSKNAPQPTKSNYNWIWIVIVIMLVLGGIIYFS